MNEILLFAILGLGTGALIAGIGLGVVLSYRGSGVINLATGASSMVAAYLFLWLTSDGLATAVALVLALAGTVIFGVLVELLVFRPLRSSSPLSSLVASLGVLLTAQAIIDLILRGGGSGKAQASADVMIGGGGSQIIPSVLPQGLVTIFGTRIPADRFWLTGIVVVAAAVLWALYRWSHFGLATRAASESQTSAMLAGLPTDRLALVNAVLAATVAGGMGILAGAVAQIDTVNLPLQVVPALGAAIFARFTSFSITCLAGLLIGAAQSLLYYAQTKPWFPTSGGVAHAGRQRRADVPGDRRRAVAAGIEPADARRADRGASARGAAAPAPGAPGDPVRRGGDRRALRRAVRLPLRHRRLARRDDHRPLARPHHRLRRPGVAAAGAARGRSRRTPCRTWRPTAG